MRLEGKIGLLCVVVAISIFCTGLAVTGRSVGWRDDFKSLDESSWWVVKGRCQASKGWLVLSSTGRNGGGAEVQSQPEFLYKTLELKLQAKTYSSDTSAGFEMWASSGHMGIVMTNGCLGILDKRKSGRNEWYHDIEGWSKLDKTKAHIVKIVWRKQHADLYLDGKLACSYQGNLVPDEAMKVRLCASNDYSDTLRVDYVNVR